MSRPFLCMLLAAALPLAPAQAQLVAPGEDQPLAAPESEPAPGSPGQPSGDASQGGKEPRQKGRQEKSTDETGRLNFPVDPEAYSILSTVKGLSTHRATYVYPLTWSEDYEGDDTEMVLQFSAKQRVFGSDLYIAYTQRSFWQYLNEDQSSPFRETNYAPEMFYRLRPGGRIFRGRGIDFGFEHESNGRSVRQSRSWNRVYVAPFQAKGSHLAYLKLWYRIPEGAESSVDNPNGDDNPDITDYLGHGEFQYSQQIGGKQLLTGWVRGNPATGRGAVAVTWSIPSAGGYAFWGITVFHGYGESLIDYDYETTRVMGGMLLAR